MKTQKKTQEQIQTELTNVWPNIIIISKYTGANNKCKLKCTDCGYEWETTVRSVISSKHGCPKCGVHNAFKNKSEQLLMSKIQKDFELIAFNNYKDVIVKCKKCGNIRHTSTNNLIRYKCRKCALQAHGDKTRKTTEIFISQAKQIHGDKFNYSKVNYINEKLKIDIICPIHGLFKQSPIKHLTGQGCPKCIGKNVSKQEFVEQCQKLYGDKYIINANNYRNLSSEIEVECQKHGKFYIKAGLLYHAICGCKQCSESIGEKEVNSILEALKLPFQREYTIKTSKQNFRVDFYLELQNQKYIIEYNGKQHYVPIKYFGGERQFQKQLSRDIYLREYCEKNNINLLEIKYTETNLEMLIKQFLKVPS